MNGRVVVLGGTGFFGRYLVEDLLVGTDAVVVVASRHAVRGSSEVRVEQVGCDVFDAASLRRALADADVVVHCAGPFRSQPTLPLDVAIGVGAHYVDISEDRSFALAVNARADRAGAAGVAVLNGCSVVPTLSIAAANLLSQLDPIEGVRTFVAPDTAKHRGPAMFTTMLWGAGRRFETLRDGAWRPVYGWSEPEWVTFPPPVGKRLLYLALEMADLDALPALTGAGTVEFKAGSEHAFLNRLLGGAASARSTLPWIDLERLLVPVRALSWVLGRVGQDRGAVMFEVTGFADGARRTTDIAIVADHDGGRIPIIPAAMAVEDLLAGRLLARGVVPPASWLTRERLLQGLRGRGLRVVRR